MGAVPNPGGTELTPQSVTVVSSRVVGGKRTVVITRPTMGVTKLHANFTLQDTTIPFINAIGSGPSFGYHAHKTAATLSLWPTAAADADAPQVCMCKEPAAKFGAATGNIRYKVSPITLLRFARSAPYLA